jgi:CRP-like cAMP-binding protein
MLTILEIVDLLREGALFRFIPTQDLALVASAAREVSFDVRQALYCRNNAPDSMFLLLEGDVELLEGRRPRRVGGGQIVGAAALLAEEPHSESAVAATPVRAIQIDQQALFDAMAENFAITRGIVKALIPEVATEC